MQFFLIDITSQMIGETISTRPKFFFGQAPNEWILRAREGVWGAKPPNFKTVGPSHEVTLNYLHPPSFHSWNEPVSFVLWSPQPFRQPG
jgi:hypothetical protein